jgi:hypothetical protein
MKLASGAGSETTGACWMSAIHWYTRGGKRTWTDQPDCVSPIVRDLCIALNDRLANDAERERVIGPHIFQPVGTNTTNEDEGKRWALVADRAARRFLPFWLRRTKKPDLIAHAAKCEALAPIVDRRTVRAALPTLKAAENAASAPASASASAYAYAFASAFASAPASASDYAYAYASAYASEKEWINSEVLKLILECCAIGRQPEERIATKSRSECLEFLCSFEKKKV